MNGRISHSGNATLAAHVAAAVIVEDPRGMRLAKASSRSRNAAKIDLAACLVMAHSRATWRATNRNTKEDKEFRSMNDLLTTLLQRLDEPAARYAELDRYYTGTQPLAFLSPEAKAALGNRFGVMASNIPRLAVTALAERLRSPDSRATPSLWPDWIRNDLDQTSGVAHREALLLGDSLRDRVGRSARAARR